MPVLQALVVALNPAAPPLPDGPQAPPSTPSPAAAVAAMPPIELLQCPAFVSGLDGACAHLATEALRQRRPPPTISNGAEAEKRMFVCPAPAGKAPCREARFVTESAVPWRLSVHQVFSYKDTWHFQCKQELHDHWQRHIARVNGGDESMRDTLQHGMLALGMRALQPIVSDEDFYAELGRAAPLPEWHVDWKSAAAAAYRLNVLVGEGPKPAAEEMSLEDGFRVVASCDVAFLDLSQCRRNDGLAIEEHPGAPNGVYGAFRRKAMRASRLNAVAVIEGRPFDCVPCDEEPAKPGTLPGCQGHDDREVDAIVSSLRLLCDAFVRRVGGVAKQKGDSKTNYVFGCQSKAGISFFKSEFAQCVNPDLPGIAVLPGLGAAFWSLHPSEARKVPGGGLLLKEPHIKTMAAAAAARADLAGGTAEEVKAAAMTAYLRYIEDLSVLSFGAVVSSFLELAFACASCPARIPSLRFWADLSAAVLKANEGTSPGSLLLAAEMACAAGECVELRNLWRLMGSVTRQELDGYDPPSSAIGNPSAEAALGLLRRRIRGKPLAVQPRPGEAPPAQEQQELFTGEDPSDDEVQEVLPGEARGQHLSFTEVVSSAVTILDRLLTDEA